jgi:hypothetical protein
MFTPYLLRFWAYNFCFFLHFVATELCLILWDFHELAKSTFLHNLLLLTDTDDCCRYTVGAAYASFMDTYVGSLSPGKYVDFRCAIP